MTPGGYMQFFTDLFKFSKWKDWYDGLLWLGWNFICGLMPIWITLLSLKLSKRVIEVKIFTGNGEFALYAASFLGTCLYIVLRDFRRGGYPSRGILSLFLVPLLLLVGLLYSTIALSNALLTQPLPLLVNIDKDFIINLSLLLLPIVFVLTFLVVVVDNVKSSEDIRAIQKESYDKLNRDFDQIGGK